MGEKSLLAAQLTWDLDLRYKQLIQTTQSMNVLMKLSASSEKIQIAKSMGGVWVCFQIRVWEMAVANLQDGSYQYHFWLSHHCQVPSPSVQIALCDPCHRMTTM